MKLKRFKKTSVWDIANIVVYHDLEGNEIDPPNSELKRRWFDNKEVKIYELYNNGNLEILDVYLK